MAAAAFVAIVKFVGQDGATWNNRCTVSDVNAAYYIWQDGNNSITMPANHGIITVTDLILSAAGTDTSYDDVAVNGTLTGIQIQHAANLATNVSRQFFGSGFNLQPGANLRIIQRT